MPPSSKTPIQEIGQRTAEAAPGLAAIAKLIATKEHEQILADARQRVRDSHRMHARALGMEDVVSDQHQEGAAASSKYMICGDVYGDEAAKQVFAGQSSQSNTAGATESPAASKMGLLAKAALAAALIGGGAGVGAGVPYLLSILQQQPETPAVEQSEQSDQDTQYELRIGTPSTP